MTGSRRRAARDKSLIRNFRIDELVQSVELSSSDRAASKTSGINLEITFDGLFLTTSQSV
jgi:3'-phosphoadenosine 5'-phosphosulfate sulfotransferase